MLPANTYIADALQFARGALADVAILVEGLAEAREWPMASETIEAQLEQLRAGLVDLLPAAGDDRLSVAALIAEATALADRVRAVANTLPAQNKLP